jgi:hypothetical protein
MSKITKNNLSMDGSSHSATIVGKENVDSGKFVILAKKWTINLFIQAKVEQTMKRICFNHYLGINPHAKC